MLDLGLRDEYIAHYRGLPNHEAGVRVRTEDHRTGVLSVWCVTTQGERGEVGTTILPLVVDFHWHEIAAWERRIDGLCQRPPATSDAPALRDLLADVLEPMMQRELLHWGVIEERRGYHGLIGWVEIR